jgi:hypothetical protein
MHHPIGMHTVGMQRYEEKFGLIHTNFNRHAIYLHSRVGQRGSATTRIMIKVFVCLEKETIANGFLAHLERE